MKRDSLKILYASSEAFPFAVSGDAGEIAGSLPQQIKLLGADIRVVLPFYATIPRRYRQEAKKISEFTVSLCWRNQYCGVFQLANAELHIISLTMSIILEGRLFMVFMMTENALHFIRRLL